MRCQYCDEKLPVRQCKECGGETVYDAKFCHRCGAAMPEIEKSAKDYDDVSARRLCSDGTCIGVIGGDNLCKECGKPYTGEA